MRGRGLIAAAVVAALAGSACRLHRVERNPAPPVEMPQSFGEGAEPGTQRGGPPVPVRWWRAFGDAGLDAVEETALAGNFDLAQAWARLHQAEALVTKATSGWWPNIDFSGQYQRNRLNFPVLGTVKENRYQAQLQAGYELDLWGKVASLRDAAKLQREAGHLAVEAAAMTVAAQVADTWFQLAQQRATLEVLRAQREVSRKQLALVEERYAQGVANALDVYQQRQQLAAVEARIPPVRAQIAVLSDQLAVLCGKAPGTFELPAPPRLVDTPPPPARGVPASLLDRRPDVHAARLQVVAADHQVAAAIADRLPTLRISGSVGYNARSLADFFDSFVGNLTLGLAAPLFDGFRRKAEVDRQRAVLEEQVAAWGAAIVRAVAEVRQAWARETHARDALERLDAQLAAARSTLEEARRSYAAGLGDYLAVLTALNAVQQLEQARLEAQRNILSARVALYRALGGDWSDVVQDPRERADARDHRSPKQPVQEAP